jgi:CO/xanthine dehydrogenase FAD-binding subunit
LTALNAQAEIASASGTRRMAFTSLFLGPGKSGINKSEELIVGFYIPLIKTGQASCFKRIMRPQGVALPILNCAVWLEREKDIIKDVHIAVGPGGPTPFRATEAENALRSQSFNDVSFAIALEELLAQVQFRTSARRASADYRKHIVDGLFRETLETAWNRAE